MKWSRRQAEGMLEFLYDSLCVHLVNNANSPEILISLV